jgi:hypothetical protein
MSVADVRRGKGGAGSGRRLASRRRSARPDTRLARLQQLASTDVETAVAADIGQQLHTLFDPVSEDALPIYFGPLLGRLYLEGL